MFTTTITSPNIDAAIKFTYKLKPMLFSASRSASGSCGAESIKRISKYIKNSGDGSWPESHPGTLGFRKSKNGVWIKRFRSKSAYKGMSSFVRYSQQGQKTFFGFAISKNPTPAFYPLLEKISKRMQMNFQTVATDKTRRMFGAQRGRSKDRPGIDFFPLRKNSVLRHPARKLDVYELVNEIVNSVFSDRFFKSLEKKQ